MFGDVLGEIMRRRQMAAVDIARRIEVAPEIVERWLRNEVIPQPEDLVNLACLLGGSDAERLLSANERPLVHPFDRSPAATVRSLDAAERAMVLSLPAVFQGAFAAALVRTPAE